MIVNKITLKVIKSDVLHIEVAAAKVIQNCDQALVYSMPRFFYFMHVSALVNLAQIATEWHHFACLLDAMKMWQSWTCISLCQ